MLTFFRRIRFRLLGQATSDKVRKGLLDGGATSKYLLYAIGEIALVVIGILIALQVNNWNLNRLDRNKENLLLNEINAEFVYNRQELASTLEYYDGVQRKYEKLIKSFPIDPNDYVLDSLSVIFQNTNMTLDVDIYQGSIATLINSSSFEIISNPELRTLLLQWNDMVSNYKEAESLLIQFTVNKFFPYLDEIIPLGYSDGIRDGRVNLSFLSSVKFENMIKRRRSLMRNMKFIVENKEENLFNAIDRIIELSTEKM